MNKTHSYSVSLSIISLLITYTYFVNFAPWASCRRYTYCFFPYNSVDINKFSNNSGLCLSHRYLFLMTHRSWYLSSETWGAWLLYHTQSNYCCAGIKRDSMISITFFNNHSQYSPQIALARVKVGVLSVGWNVSYIFTFLLVFWIQ